RQLYLTMPEVIQKHFGGIAQQGRGQRFIAWATRMNPAGGALSPFLQFVYSLRPDLAAVLPDANGKDRGAFLEWAQTHGPREMGYNPDFARPTGPRPSSHCPDVTNQQVQNDVREVTRTAIPADATVLVVGHDHPRLLEHMGRTAWHFPQTADGQPAGAASSGPAAIDQLEALRAQGAGYLLLPRTARAWLDRHSELKHHLREHYRLAVEHDTCLVYDLMGGRYEWVGSLPGVPRFAPLSIPELQPAPPRCSIIIPVHGKAALTRQCLEVLLSPPYERTTYEIIVVDDASPDETAQVLADYSGRIRVVTHTVNQGFARTCNDGAAAAGGEYLVFLNNDTIPQPGWLDALVRYRES